MQWTRTTERDQRKVARVVASPDRDQANAIGHVRVRHLHNRARGLLDAHIQPLRDASADRLCRAVSVKRDAAADQGGSRRPSMRLASVFVGSVEPRP